MFSVFYVIAKLSFSLVGFYRATIVPIAVVRCLSICQSDPIGISQSGLLCEN